MVGKTWDSRRNVTISKDMTEGTMMKVQWNLINGDKVAGCKGALGLFRGQPHGLESFSA